MQPKLERITFGNLNWTQLNCLNYYILDQRVKTSISWTNRKTSKFTTSVDFQPHDFFPFKFPVAFSKKRMSWAISTFPVPKSAQLLIEVGFNNEILTKLLCKPPFILYSTWYFMCGLNIWNSLSFCLWENTSFHLFIYFFIRNRIFILLIGWNTKDKFLSLLLLIENRKHSSSLPLASA